MLRSFPFGGLECGHRRKRAAAASERIVLNLGGISNRGGISPEGADDERI